MKAHYERVSAPRSHSTSNDPGDHEGLSELDQLCLRLYAEFQEALDIQEAIKRDNLLDKENIVMRRNSWLQTHNLFLAQLLLLATL
jgi:hypothetical protein